MIMTYYFPFEFFYPISSGMPLVFEAFEKLHDKAALVVSVLEKADYRCKEKVHPFRSHPVRII